jgi:hypothetical protein
MREAIILTDHRRVATFARYRQLGTLLRTPAATVQIAIPCRFVPLVEASGADARTKRPDLPTRNRRRMNLIAPQLGELTKAGLGAAQLWTYRCHGNATQALQYGYAAATVRQGF